MRGDRHIINKVFLEVNTDSIETGHYLKDNLDVFLKEKILPDLEAYFDALQRTLPKNGGVQIEKIAMDFSFGDSIDFDVLKEAIKRKVKTELDGKNGQNPKMQVASAEKRTEETFFHFFETGTLPWWSDPSDVKGISDQRALDDLLTSSDFMAKLKNRLNSERFKLRLIKQSGDEHLIKICARCWAAQNDGSNDIAPIIASVLQAVKNSQVSPTEFLALRQRIYDIVISLLGPIDRQALKPKLLFLVTSLFKGEDKRVIEAQVVQILDRGGVDKILTALKDRLSMDGLKDHGSGIKTTNDRKSVTEKEEIENIGLLQKDSSPKFSDKATLSDLYVENAGLILIHPFLKSLFLNCQLFDNTKIIDPERAAHLLHYIATKGEMPYEHHMIFEKFLCDIPLNHPINRTIELTSDLKLQAEDVLKTVAQNWSALGNASVDLLRNEYLRRPGKLVFTKGNPKVIVERKTQDILLEKLPWGIGICKLPWKKKLIFTEW